MKKHLKRTNCILYKICLQVGESKLLNIELKSSITNIEEFSNVEPDEAPIKVQILHISNAFSSEKF